LDLDGGLVHRGLSALGHADVPEPGRVVRGVGGAYLSQQWEVPFGGERPRNVNRGRSRCGGVTGGSQDALQVLNAGSPSPFSELRLPPSRDPS
jgi:hypothetical protein